MASRAAGAGNGSVRHGRNSGFDVVVPTAPYMQRQILSGAYLPLDKTALPNLVNLDPTVASRLARCGISFIDDPAPIVRLVLKYLGRDTDMPSAQDLAAAEAALLAIRPFIRTIDSVGNIEAIAIGDICIAVAYIVDFVQAR